VITGEEDEKQTNETEITAAKQKIIFSGSRCAVLPHAARDTKQIVTDNSSSDASPQDGHVVNNEKKECSSLQLEPELNHFTTLSRDEIQM
jgi:hypothetical protein